MEKKLNRNEQEKMVAGVCAGLAEYFDIDVTWVRIAFVVLTLAGFSGVLAYIVLWIAVPAKPFDYNSYRTDYRVYEDAKTGAPDYVAADQPYTKEKFKSRKSGNGRMIVGLMLLLFGGFFLMDEFNIIPYWFDFEKLWPLVFIIPGILMIAKAGKQRDVVPEEETTWGENTSATASATTDLTVSDTNTTSSNDVNTDDSANSTTNTDQTQL
ncbi:MAG: PspC domain-containing protein [Daejeonella sp.]